MNGQNVKRLALAAGAAALAFAQRTGRWWLATFRSAGNRGKVLFGCGSLFAGCFVVSLCMASLGLLPNTTPTPLAAAAIAEETAAASEPATEAASPTDTPPTVTVSLTPLPTATSSPTAEPTNTPTPGPTNTPRPTATPSPTANAEAEYREAAGRVAEGYFASLQWMSELFTEAGQDTSLVFDEDWRERMVLALALMRASGQSLRELTPPATLASAHEHFLVAADHYDAVVNLTADAIDELDAEKLTAAQSEMLLGSEAVRRATEALNAVGEESTLPAATNTLPPPTSAPVTATDPPPLTPTEGPPPPEPVGNCVNINTASLEELQQIIHIGPDRAAQIIQLRPFSSVDAMSRIDGIGPGRLADIKAQGLACV